jgi:hypothetical protein
MGQLKRRTAFPRTQRVYCEIPGPAAGGQYNEDPERTGRDQDCVTQDHRKCPGARRED